MTQTGKTRFERWNNVMSAFGIQDEKLLEGKHVLLVDDVITTGSTTREVAKILKRSGAASISAIAVAKTRNRINY